MPCGGPLEFRPAEFWLLELWPADPSGGPPVLGGGAVVPSGLSPLASVR